MFCVTFTVISCVARLSLRMSALLQVILRRLVFRVESTKCIFGIALFSSKLDDVTDWYQKQFGNGDVTVQIGFRATKVEIVWHGPAWVTGDVTSNDLSSQRHGFNPYENMLPCECNQFVMLSCDIS
jgi:hypothetical protein